VVPFHDTFMMPALARKASDADAPNLNPWRPAIFDHPLPRRVFPGRTSWRPTVADETSVPRFPTRLARPHWKLDVTTAAAAYAIMRRRTAACCSRIASVNTSNPGMLGFCSSSMKPRRRRSSTSAAFWFRKEPPPNNLIKRRCSDLVNSPQGIAGIVVMLPVVFGKSNAEQLITKPSFARRLKGRINRAVFAQRNAFSISISTCNVT
jgi:hypothetical protein